MPVKFINVSIALIVTALLAAVMAESHSALRQKMCHSDTDCVTVVSGTGQLTIDELDFEKHTVLDLLKKLPSWFGPQRPVEFVYNGKTLDPKTVFAKYGLPLGAKVNVVSAVKPEL
jgi:hypothetical protein